MPFLILVFLSVISRANPYSDGVIDLRDPNDPDNILMLPPLCRNAAERVYPCRMNGKVLYSRSEDLVSLKPIFPRFDLYGCRVEDQVPRKSLKKAKDGTLQMTVECVDKDPPKPEPAPVAAPSPQPRTTTAKPIQVKEKKKEAPVATREEHSPQPSWMMLLGVLLAGVVLGAGMHRFWGSEKT